MADTTRTEKFRQVPGRNLLLIERHGTAHNEIYVIDLIDEMETFFGLGYTHLAQGIVNVFDALCPFP